MAASSDGDCPQTQGEVVVHPDDDVTPAQRAYTTAFVDWIRSGSDEHHRRREAAFELMMREREAQ
jgi:hypothetical protein